MTYSTALYSNYKSLKMDMEFTSHCRNSWGSPVQGAKKIKKIDRVIVDLSGDYCTFNDEISTTGIND